MLCGWKPGNGRCTAPSPTLTRRPGGSRRNGPICTLSAPSALVRIPPGCAARYRRPSGCSSSSPTTPARGSPRRRPGGCSPWPGMRSRGWGFAETGDPLSLPPKAARVALEARGLTVAQAAERARDLFVKTLKFELLPEDRQLVEQSLMALQREHSHLVEAGRAAAEPASSAAPAG